MGTRGRGGRGKIRNLRWLDIQLALIALDQNLAPGRDTLRRVVRTQLANELTPKIRSRSLQGASYQAGWLLRAVQDWVGIRGIVTAVAVPTRGTLTRLRLEFNGTRSLPLGDASRTSGKRFCGNSGAAGDRSINESSSQ